MFDFGENMSGLCRLKISGERGTKVEMQHGELLKDNGRVEMRNIDIYYDPMPGLGFQTDYYTLKGDGEETFTPDFNYHGFRWVEVRSDRPMKLDENSLTALYMHTAVEPVGEFRCSNDMLNEVWKATRRAYLANLMSIPTDCPQREKNGWTADAALAIDLALLNYDGILFYEKWFDDVADNIREDGRIAGIIPTSGWGYDDWIGPVWDASILIIPNAIYNYYGRQAHDREDLSDGREVPDLFEDPRGFDGAGNLRYRRLGVLQDADAYGLYVELLLLPRLCADEPFRGTDRPRRRSVQGESRGVSARRSTESTSTRPPRRTPTARRPRWPSRWDSASCPRATSSVWPTIWPRRSKTTISISTSARSAASTPCAC